MKKPTVVKLLLYSLPPDKRNVTIYYYCSTNPKAKTNESLDISILKTPIKNQEIWQMLNN